MAAGSLGTKRICTSCGIRFFDLGRIPAACPACGTVQEAQVSRLKSGSYKPFDKRKLSDYVHIEKPEDSEAKEADDETVDGDSRVEGSLHGDEGGLDEAGGIIPPKPEE